MNIVSEKTFFFFNLRVVSTRLTLLPPDPPPFSLSLSSANIITGDNGQIISYLIGDATRENEMTTQTEPPEVEPPAARFSVVMNDDGTTTTDITEWWPNGTPFDNMTFNVGDTVVFRWSEGFTHNVIIHPTGTCTESDGDIFLGNEFPVTYTFTETDKDTGSITFACDVSGLFCCGSFCFFLLCC